MSGIFALMLHSHIPYCRKSGVWPAGEEWLFEAMYETYIPLLSVLRRFQMKGMKPRIMIGIVPILAEQLNDPYMRSRFCEYMEDKIRRSQQDIRRFETDKSRRAVAEYWYNLFSETYRAFTQDFYTDILGTFKWLQEEGVIEIVTSAATHGFLPLFEHDSGIFSQIHLGVESYKKYFGCNPKGIWLPECAYRPREWSDRWRIERKAIDEWLADENIEYFFVENIGITSASFIENKNNEKQPSTYRGYRLDSGVHVFGRNPATSKQVWSAESGYPGNPVYREFHQKDSESGLHYWKVTGTNQKAIYDPNQARIQVKHDAINFVELIKQKMESRNPLITECSPLIVSMYDSELFGHWWHEGIMWIEEVYTLLLKDNQIQTKTLSEVISMAGPTYSTIQMKPSTWGENSDFTVWNNPEHAWLWPYINASIFDFERVINQIKQSQREINERDLRILNQIARELLLMEGSDWPFLLYTQQAKEYANQRFHHHHQRFNKLLWAAKNLDDLQRLGDHDLKIIEEIDNPFPNINYHWFESKIF